MIKLDLKSAPPDLGFALLNRIRTKISYLRLVLNSLDIRLAFLHRARIRVRFKIGIRIRIRDRVRVRISIRVRIKIRVRAMISIGLVLELVLGLGLGSNIIPVNSSINTPTIDTK